MSSYLSASAESACVIVNSQIYCFGMSLFVGCGQNDMPSPYVRKIIRASPGIVSAGYKPNRGTLCGTSGFLPCNGFNAYLNSLLVRPFVTLVGEAGSIYDAPSTLTACS